MNFDSEAAAKRCTNLWRKLGTLYEKAAYAAIERDMPHKAMECARMADVCFWQATGEGHGILMNEMGRWCG